LLYLLSFSRLGLLNQILPLLPSFSETELLGHGPDAPINVSSSAWYIVFPDERKGRGAGSLLAEERC
jgi:hypothetical protein